MNGKTIVITGGNDGIGYQTALSLAGQGANVIIVSRNEQKAKDAVQQIKAANHGNVQFVLADVSKQKDIRKAAAEIRGMVEKIDVLINNAGGTFGHFELTEDGLEKTIATNHFAYFLLTGLLLDLVLKSEYGRIINVSSNSHFRGDIDLESFTKNKGYFVLKAYGQSKLANVMFTIDLAERLKKSHVTVNALHPGFVKTRIGRKSGHPLSVLWSMLVQLGAVSLEKGAETSLYLATSPQVKGVTGKYFAKCKQKEPKPIAHDAALRKKLWDFSEKHAGIIYSV